MSENTKKYLLSLNLKNGSKKEIDYKWINRIVIDEESHNMLFLLEFHLEYPLRIWEYVLVYKDEMVIIDIEGGAIIKNRIVRIWLPEALQKEKEKILGVVVDMVLQFQKVFMSKFNEKGSLQTEDIKYLTR